MNTTILILISFSVLVLILIGAIFFLLTKFSKTNQSETGIALLQQQVESLRSQISDTLIKTNEMTNQQLATTSLQLQQQMHSVQQTLQTTSGQINTQLSDTSKVVQNVQNQLGSLSQATERIFEATKNISTLEDILKPPKIRGGMGEILLENLLREILPSQDFFEMQHAFKSGDKVDAVIQLKDGMIPVDAKFPLENFKKMIETKNENEKEIFRKDFIKNVKKHIDDIAQKYILPNEGTFNFALMYVPAENVYYEVIIRSDEISETGTDLYSYATKKHVFPVSPNSLYPYLMTLSLGFRGLKIEEKARFILDELQRLYGDLEKFTNDFKIVGNHLSNAEKKYNEAEKRLGQIETKLTALNEGTPQTNSSGNPA